jgi:hypothetical protein
VPSGKAETLLGISNNTPTEHPTSGLSEAREMPSGSVGKVRREALASSGHHGGQIIMWVIIIHPHSLSSTFHTITLTTDHLNGEVRGTGNHPPGPLGSS